MAKPKVPNTKLHPIAYDALLELQARIYAEIGRREDRQDIVSAVIYGITAPQAAGMLTVFHREAAAHDADEAT